MSVCLRVPVRVHVHEHMTRSQFVCTRLRPRLLKPRGSRGQLAAPCSQTACTLLGHSLGLQPRALEPTSGGYQPDKQAEQYNKSVRSMPILCTVRLRKHLIQVF